MSLLAIIAGIIAIVIGFIIISKITGFIFRLVVLAVLVVFLYYLYQSGIDEMIMAPGAPGSEIIENLVI